MRTSKGASTKARRGISAAKLAEMIEDATVDAHDESEQAMGWLAMFEEHVELPFETVVLGVPVRVTRIDSRDDGRLIAVCRRGRHQQAIGLADLPLPTPAPTGAEWIEAYCRWVSGR